MPKKSKIAKAVATKARVVKRRKNPGKLEATAYSLAAGVAGYAVSKFASRLAYAQTIKRFPKVANHAKALTPVAAAFGVHFGSKYWSKSAEYTEEITIGASVAAVQAIVQTYLPKFAWLISDVQASEYQAPAVKMPSTASSSVDLFEEFEEMSSLPEVEEMDDSGLSDFDNSGLADVIPMLGD